MMINSSKFYSCLCFITICYFISAIQSTNYDSDILEEIVRNHGYHVEVFDILTKDGYIISLYRIFDDLNEINNEHNKSAVMLIHGLGGVPHHWLTLGPKEALAYYLVDRGLDVWLFCARGTISSSTKKHIKYDWNDDLEYWDFSYHHIGVYDLTACVDFIIATTKQQKIFLVGHAGGNTAFFAMCSDKPRYNDKIKIAVSYSPSLIFKYLDYSFITFMSSLIDILKTLFKMLGFTELVPGIHRYAYVIKTLCRDPDNLRVCSLAAATIGNFDSVLMDKKKIIPNVIGTFPQRLSSRQIFHFLENIKSGSFKKYNLGSENNLKIYGQKRPSLYNISSCVAPMALFIAPKDGLCSKEDMEIVESILPNIILKYEVPFKKFGHLDFLFASNASALVYERTYQLFKQYDEYHSKT